MYISVRNFYRLIVSKVWFLKDMGYFIDMIIRFLICFIDCVELFV